MKSNEKILEFISAFESSMRENIFVKLSLGNYKGNDENLKNIYVKKILIKSDEKLSFTYRYKTRDIVKNYLISEGIFLIQQKLTEEFYVATLFTTEYDLQFENLFNKKITIRKISASVKDLPLLNHDRIKNRQIIASSVKNYGYVLNII